MMLIQEFGMRFMKKSAVHDNETTVKTAINSTLLSIMSDAAHYSIGNNEFVVKIRNL